MPKTNTQNTPKIYLYPPKYHQSKENLLDGRHKSKTRTYIGYKLNTLKQHTRKATDDENWRCFGGFLPCFCWDFGWCFFFEEALYLLVCVGSYLWCVRSIVVVGGESPGGLWGLPDNPAKTGVSTAPPVSSPLRHIGHLLVVAGAFVSRRPRQQSKTVSPFALLATRQEFKSLVFLVLNENISKNPVWVLLNHTTKNFISSKRKKKVIYLRPRGFSRIIPLVSPKISLRLLSNNFFSFCYFSELIHRFFSFALQKDRLIQEALSKRPFPSPSTKGPRIQ